MIEIYKKGHRGGWWYVILLMIMVGIVLGIINPVYAQDEGGDPTNTPGETQDGEESPLASPAAPQASPVPGAVQGTGKGSGSISITPPDATQFPNVGFYFSLFDPQGNFARDLKPENVQVLENNYDRPIQTLNIVQPGVQIITALNIAPIMANKMGEMTYFQYIQRDLVAWAQHLPTGAPDDFSLSTNTGLQAIREKDPGKWAQSLASYSPDLKKTVPNMVSLTQALDLATDPNPNPFMKRAILYVTPLTENENLAALPNLASRAVQLGVRVYIWVITSPTDGVPQKLAPFQQFADSTGGKLFTFTGKEALPDPNSYFDPLRYLYLLNYTSGVKESGSNRVLVRIEQNDFQVVSSEQTFSIKIAPPNPIFMEPPSLIERVWETSTGKSKGQVLQPMVVPLRIMVEFPDGRQRPLKVTRLLVNGNVVAENTTAPFDKFSWQIEQYNQTGSHILQVEVEDSLGLKKSSIETTIKIVVQPPKQSITTQIFTLRGLAVLVAILAAAGVLFFALSGGRSLLSRLQLDRIRLRKDPLTQPVVIQQEPRRSAAAHSPTVPRPVSGLSAPARLLRLSDAGHPIPASALPLNRTEVTLGSDPKQSIFSLDSSSVDPLHARLMRNPDGSFQVFDAGSVAGTWVNFAPVSSMGIFLQHGDIIHLGRVAFRFELSLPPQIKQPLISPYKEEML